MALLERKDTTITELSTTPPSPKQEEKVQIEQVEKIEQKEEEEEEFFEEEEIITLNADSDYCYVPPWVEQAEEDY